MPDLNELLRWSIANSVPQQPAAQDDTQALSLRFNPSSTAQAGTSALHPSDPLYRAGSSDNASPASTPGPATPNGGASNLPSIPKRSELTSDILDVIMGKSDSVSMKEKMAFAVDENNDVDARVDALDDFEMLIEMIDNANNMAVLKLWEPLLSLLSCEHDVIVAHACWAVGTAVQNNLKAQAALFIHNALPKIMDIIDAPSGSRTHPDSTRTRATYAFSSALKHWPLAASVLSASSDRGYSVLATGIADSSLIIQRKVSFLIHTLVLQSDEKYEVEIPGEVRRLVEEQLKETGGKASESLVDGLKRTGVFGALLGRLRAGANDVEFEENAVRALSQAERRGGLSAEQKAAVRTIWKEWGAKGQEERGLAGRDAKDIDSILQ